MLFVVGIVDLRVDLLLDGDGEAAELDEAARQLRRELLELDVDEVRPVVSDTPTPGTRAVDAAVLGSLAITAGREVIGGVVRALMQWIGRRANRSVKITIGEDSIELSDVSAEDQHRLIESFLARHTAEA
jgi:hypothetical protein